MTERTNVKNTKTKAMFAVVALVLALLVAAAVQSAAAAETAPPPAPSKDPSKGAQATQGKVVSAEAGRALDAKGGGSSGAKTTSTSRTTSLAGEGLWLGSQGYIGPNRLQDYPGASCYRASANRNGTIVAGAPSVWANRAYTRRQTVGYQAQVLQWDHIGGTRFTKAFTGPRIYRTAYPNARANFPNTVFTIPTTGYTQNYTVRIHMYWYDGSSRMQGHAVRDVQFYIASYGGSAWQAEPDYCRI